MRDRFRVYDGDQCVLETANAEKVRALLSRMKNDGTPKALVQFVVAGAPVDRVTEQPALFPGIYLDAIQRSEQV